MSSPAPPHRVAIDATGNVPTQGPPAQSVAEISDTIVVGGDYSEESPDESDDSFDAYGEDDGQDQKKNEPVSGNDDYARTSDSPGHRDKGEASEAQHDVSKASESMNSSSAPETLKSQSPAAPTSDTSSLRAAESLHPASLSASLAGAASSLAAGLLPTAASEELPAASAVSPGSPSAHEDDAAVDIQKLVDDITARAAASVPSPVSLGQAPPAASRAISPALTTSHSSSLPPKPSISQQPEQLPALPQGHAFQAQLPGSHASLMDSMPTEDSATPHGTFQTIGAPGTTSEPVSSLPLPPPTSLNGSHAQPDASLSSATPVPATGDGAAGNLHSVSEQQQAWEDFQADEKRYTSEAKWERFPENSRIFIGNLSSERVSKREVFDVFHNYGRLAQISLKNAYGFVQYHTRNEGQTAMENAQGIELGGRKIHLEFSRAQKRKDKEKDDRGRSPERRNQRGGGRGNDRGATDRYDKRDHRRRDDYRPGRSPSPRRHDRRGSRDVNYPRERDPPSVFDRRRSRSPTRFSDPYRRRSPSPRRRAPSDADRLDVAQRFGADVPDVQFFVLPEVSREFIDWVQQRFHERGLRTNVMFLNPRFPRDALVQRQVLEGVHAIVDLDHAAQSRARISIQVFIRSGGSAHFNTYQDIDPVTAVGLVIAQTGNRLTSPPTQYNHGHSYLPDAPLAGYPYHGPHASAPPVHARPTASAPDLASMVGQLDNPTLQALIASLQASQGHAGHQSANPMLPATVGPQAPPIDLNALLGNLQNPATAQPVPAAGYAGMPNYGSASAYYPPLGQAMTSAVPNAPAGMMGYGGPDAAQQVQTIMESLRRGSTN
ncbi:hypothetical protein B0T26DRAFT_648465 [Lasiosphaeria miniovina]|uniref:RRM domain-containing protein n=1 Tax=Lasiosphaeria miniovina TaxID=1954250 RepID=A0AA40DR51_9PEZI|nr:uncharacterized protein B0T26DRAFT_648465 [Lasiosphaeria miniovina]KAK0713089.1 hypothetical protein B0T26DRAFT_648465 [Lasiosphaeria miniovina]